MFRINNKLARYVLIASHEGYNVNSELRGHTLHDSYIRRLVFILGTIRKARNESRIRKRGSHYEITATHAREDQSSLVIKIQTIIY